VEVVGGIVHPPSNGQPVVFAFTITGTVVEGITAPFSVALRALDVVAETLSSTSPSGDIVDDFLFFFLHGLTGLHGLGEVVLSTGFFVVSTVWFGECFWTPLYT